MTGRRDTETGSQTDVPRGVPVGNWGVVTGRGRGRTRVSVRTTGRPSAAPLSVWRWVGPRPRTGRVVFRGHPCSPGVP